MTELQQIAEQINAASMDGKTVHINGRLVTNRYMPANVYGTGTLCVATVAKSSPSRTYLVFVKPDAPLPTVVISD